MTDENIPVQFGYAEEDITPDWPVELVGFSRVDNTSKGVRHKLIAQVLLCRANDGDCCLVAIDSIGFTVELSNRLRDLIAEELSSSRDRAMVCFSHTHAAPDAGIDPKYYSLVCDRVLAAVKRAQRDMGQLNAAWAIAKSDIGINRRGDDAVVDKRLAVLELADELDRPRVLLLRVTAHANVVSSDNYEISPDYFGTTRDLLEDKFGCKVIMVQGASGDIRPKYQQDNAEYLEVRAFEASCRQYTQTEREHYFRQSQEALAKMAHSILQSVSGVLAEMRPVPVYRLTMFSKRHVFFADVPDMQRALRIANEARKAAGIDGRDWLREVERLNQNQVNAQKAEIEFQFFVLNAGCLCGIANEAMCEIALDIEQRTNDPLLLFGGYVNGIDSYLPTAKEYDKGGYEVLWSNLIYFRYHGRVMPLNIDTAEAVAQFVSDTWIGGALNSSGG